MTDKKEQLLQMLQEKSFRYSLDTPFALSSGQKSSYYIDTRPVTHSAEGLNLIGEIFYDFIKDLDVQAVGGPSGGADPIAHAVAFYSYQMPMPVNAFSVRKFNQEYGMGSLVAGDVKFGDKVVIVEDVITTGSSILRAIQAARYRGLTVVKVLILVDRKEGGKKAVASTIPQTEALFTFSQLKKHLAN